MAIGSLCPPSFFHPPPNLLYRQNCLLEGHRPVAVIDFLYTGGRSGGGFPATSPKISSLSIFPPLSGAFLFEVYGFCALSIRSRVGRSLCTCDLFFFHSGDFNFSPRTLCLGARNSSFSFPPPRSVRSSFPPVPFSRRFSPFCTPPLLSY